MRLAFAIIAIILIAMAAIVAITGIFIEPDPDGYSSYQYGEGSYNWGTQDKAARLAPQLSTILAIGSITFALMARKG